MLDKNRVLKPKVYNDVIFVSIVILCMHFIFIQTNLFESIIEFTKDHERYQLDEIIMTLFFGSLFIILYITKRKFDSMTYQKNLEELNKQLKEDLENKIENSKKS